MQKLRLDLVAGARPDFIKLSSLYHRLAQSESAFTPRLVHTGQHYDTKLCEVFFTDLGLPQPHVNLHVGSAPTSQQTARVMEAYENCVKRSRPQATLVVGDTTSTLGCALAAAQTQLPLIHLEAGLRSFDRAMPEEINRVLTDRMADLHLVPSEDAMANLRREGVDDEQIQFVGNTTIDALESHLERARTSRVLATLGLEPGRYGLATLHRAGNVDSPEVLSELALILAELSTRLPIVVPAHPRLKKNLLALDSRITEQLKRASHLSFIDPLGYIDFVALEMQARLVLTDSGGVQDETTVLGIPCLTLRHNTERPVTVHQGTNVLVGHDRNRILNTIDEVLALPMPGARLPRHWDGQAAGRVVEALTNFMRAPRSQAPKAALKPAVKAFLLPHVSAHRSATVRRELLYIAESGEWQNASGTEQLSDRVASYAGADRVVLCADSSGGFATLRAHYSGRVAVLSGFVPDDIASTLNGSATPWAGLSEPLPADVEMVYIPPVQIGSWTSADTQALAEAAGRYPTLPFVVDERWFEYSRVSAEAHMKQADNLILLRSLGPAFGLDGLGAGYMLASRRMLPDGVAKASEAAILPVTRRAAWVALVDLGYCQEYVHTRLTTRSWIARSLESLGFNVVPLPGPHVFVRGDIPAALAGQEGVGPTEGGWLWAIGTPDQIEDQFSRLETEQVSVTRS